MKAYKGFNKDMTCRRKQYEIGKTYEEDQAVCCEKGMHACEYPLDCFKYYDPSDSVSCEVECDGDISRNDADSKLSCTEMTISGKLDIVELVKASFDYIRLKTGKVNNTLGSHSVNSSTGAYSANRSIGLWSVNSATGDCSANSATGGRSVNSTTGDISANSAIGHGSANISTGNDCKNYGGEGTISVGWGKENKCKGDIGAYIVLCERGEWDDEKYPMIGEPVFIKIDGEKYKPDTWYMMKNGKVVEEEE